jgi:hypothetical protein
MKYDERGYENPIDNIGRSFLGFTLKRSHASSARIGRPFILGVL